VQIENSYGLNIGLNIDIATASIPVQNDYQPTPQRLNQAADSYSRSSRTAQILEAEYVDNYPAQTATQIKATSSSNPVILNTETPQKPSSQTLAYYNQPVNDGPLPGSLLNIFA
jgi:hypothetical protein